VGVQLQKFTVEDGIARLLGQALARAAHRTSHIAMAMRFPAVDDDLIRCSRGL
jgi:hypothetical protein